MVERYRLAMAMGQHEFEKVVREDEALLSGVGLRLLSVEGGLRAAVEKEVNGKVHPWNVLEISAKTWKWLRPLLVEITAARSPEVVEVENNVVELNAIAL